MPMKLNNFTVFYYFSQTYILLFLFLGYIVATRAFEVLALILGIVCIVVTTLWFILDVKRFNLVMMITSLASGFLCGTLTF